MSKADSIMRLNYHIKMKIKDQAVLEINNIQKLSNLIGQENLRGKTLELDFFQT